MNVFYLSGVVAFEAGDYQNAQALFVEATRENPLEKEAFFYLAQSYFLNDYYDDAISSLEQYLAFPTNALDDEKNKAYAFDLFGQCYMKKGQKVEALTKYRESLRVYPNAASTLNNLSLCYIELAEEDIQKNELLLSRISFLNAKKCIEKVFSLCEANPFFLHTLATWYEKYILVVERISTQEELFVKVSFHFTEAIKYYSKALEMCRKDDEKLKRAISTNLSQCHAKLGHHLYRHEKYSEAMVQYAETLKLDSSDLIALNQMGMCFSKQEQFSQAREYFVQILSVTEDSQELADAWLNIAYTYRLEKSFSFAVEALNHAKSYAPEDECIVEEEAQLSAAMAQKNLGTLSFLRIKERQEQHRLICLLPDLN